MIHFYREKNKISKNFNLSKYDNECFAQHITSKYYQTKVSNSTKLKFGDYNFICNDLNYV